MSTHPRLACAFVLCALTLPVSAQMKPVTVDLNTGALSPSVPFDERFRLLGSADTNAQTVTLTYGKLDRASCEKQQKPSGTCAGVPAIEKPTTQTWQRHAPGAANFAFIIEPLDANTCYGFHISQSLSTASEDDRKKIRESLSKSFRAALAEKFKQGQLTGTVLTGIADTLDEKAKTLVQTQLQACTDQRLIEAADVTAAQGSVVRLNTELTDAKTNIANRRDEVLHALCLKAPCVASTSKLWESELRPALRELVIAPGTLSDPSLKTWAGALDPSIEGFDKTTMAQVARAIGSSSFDELEGLISGTWKFASSTLVPTDTPSPQSIALLAAFMDAYTSNAFQKANVGTPVVDATTARDFRNEAPIRGLAAALAQEAATKQLFDAAQLPDLLADIVLSRKYNVSATATAITDGKNPYVGVDAGIAYVFRLDKPAVYAGANLYAVPVNKDQKIPHGGIEGFLKRTSLVLGLATTIDGTTGWTGVGNPLIGVGYRVSRYMKFSGGIVGFKLKDPNLLIEKQRVKTEPFFSISIDTDLKTLLGGFGKIFGS